MLEKNKKTFLTILKIIFSFNLAIAVFGCGVKGKPMPPDQPPEIGRGEKLLEVNKAKAAEKNKKNKIAPKKPESN